MNYWLLLIPFVSAILGWFGSWIAGNILLKRIIPAKQPELAIEIGKIAAEEFSFAAIKDKISDPQSIQKVMPVVEEHIDDFLRHKLKAKIPMIGMLIGDKTISSLKEIFMKEIEEMFPQVMSKFTGNLEDEFNIQTLVTAKINSMPPAKWHTVLSPVLRYFGAVGAIVGFVTGLVNTGLFLAVL